MGVLARAWTAKSKVAKVPGLYPAFRAVTTKLGDGRVYTVRVGPLKGMRWRRDNSFPFWYHTGLWEPHVSALIDRHLRPGDTFWDVGANGGYHTLHAARVVGPSGAVVAIEADPNVARALEDNVAMNDLGNVTVVVAAVGGTDGTATFTRRANNLTSGLATTVQGGDAIEVRTVRLDSLLDEAPAPHVVKMDIEGGEIEAIPVAERLVGQVRPRWLMSTHGPEARRLCLDAFERHRYHVESEPGFGQMLVATPRPDGQRTA